MAKRLDNVQFIRSIMEHSEFGALAQIFVLDAIAKVADKVAGADPIALRVAFGETPFIDPVEWQGVAAELSRKFKERTP